MHSRQRVAWWSLGALTLLPLAHSAAQGARRTTVGHLLGGSVDTIAVRENVGGRRGGTDASLQLVRVDSGYSGTLRLYSWRAGIPHMSTDTSSQLAERRCDTTMKATMTPPAARRLFALLRPAVIEPGEPPDGPTVSDDPYEYWYRLTSGSNTVLVYKGRSLRHGEARYRAPLKHDSRHRTQPSWWAAVDMNTPLMKADEMLRPYLQPGQLIAFDRACRGE